MSATPRTDAFVTYMAYQFPATVGHIPMRRIVEELERDSIRLKWLHTGSGKDPEGYEWGVARIKHDANGQVVSALWTLSDHSDLDAEMAREGAS